MPRIRHLPSPGSSAALAFRPIPTFVFSRAATGSPRPRSSRRPYARSAFTLIELALVLAIVGVVAALAVPRLSSAADNAKLAQIDANQRALQEAIDFYSAEHSGNSPAINPNGTTTTSGVLFMRRLLERTDELGNLDPAGIFGPYLRSPPKNPYLGMATVRIDGVATATNTTGWRFDSVSQQVKPDDSGVATRRSKYNAVIEGALSVTDAIEPE